MASAKKYKKTHPWIRFELKLAPSDYNLWLQLGEVASKVEHLSGVPLKPSYTQELHKIFLAKGVMATTAIEGNTLTEEQVKKEVEGTLKLPTSQKYLQQEIQNILAVCNQEIIPCAHPDHEIPKLTPKLIQMFNRRVLEKLEVEEGVFPGEFRDISVVVGNVYRGAPAEECPYLTDKLCEWLDSSDFQFPTEDMKVPFALVKAIVAHIYLAWIHPFGDGNGRTARLVELLILFTNGVPLPAAHLLSDHYNRTRSQYYRELDKASKSNGDILPFIRYAVQGFLDGIREQIQLVRAQQLQVHWENFVHEQFNELKQSPTQKRRRNLAIDLYDWSSEFIPTHQIYELNPRQARAFALAGERMLQRDLNALAKMGLVERKYGKIRARTEIIQAFLPRKVEGP